MPNNFATILVADDEPHFRTFLGTILSNAGYSVLTAENGLTAWNLFQQHRPDLVIADLQMPQLDGLGLTRKIRELDPDTPVIIMSERGTMEEVIEALRIGAHDYLSKPIVDKELPLHAVRKALEHLHMSRLAEAYHRQLRHDVEETTAALKEELDRKIEMEQELRQTKEEWENTFNAIPDLIALIDRDHRFLRINRAMADFLGCSPPEAVGRRCCEVMHRLPHPPDFCPHNQLLLDGAPHRIEVFDEVMGGDYEISVVPFLDRQGTLLGSIHLARDISDRRRKEEEQRILQAQLLQAQKLESIGQLAAGIAHEINTPVQFIGTNNEFLTESFQDIDQLIDAYDRLYQAAIAKNITPELIEEVTQCNEQADWEYLSKEVPLALEQNKIGVHRVSSIVMAMKEFSHPGSKSRELRDINKLINTTITVARNEWKYVADIVTNFAPDIPEVNCYSDELNQVFLNIIVNAAHAIEEKLGRTPELEKGTITITTRRGADNFVEICINDTGCGIPETIVAKVFDPFFTTKKQGRGTGQGLAIARNIIEERHEGRIVIQSTEEVGTSFVLSLPI